ncbi:hypothetical protein HK101_003356 [Irineochytrium annulatum]|nr:hypothetical protein HK101_003356 [Irineochytrium annulatum]
MAATAAGIPSSCQKKSNTTLEQQLKDLRLSAKLKITKLQREIDQLKASLSTTDIKLDRVRLGDAVRVEPRAEADGHTPGGSSRRHASRISIRKRVRFSYWSVRKLEFSQRNCSIRYPCAAWISMPSNPARRLFRAQMRGRVGFGLRVDRNDLGGRRDGERVAGLGMLLAESPGVPDLGEDEAAVTVDGLDPLPTLAPALSLPSPAPDLQNEIDVLRKALMLERMTRAELEGQLKRAAGHHTRSSTASSTTSAHAMVGAAAEEAVKGAKAELEVARKELEVARKVLEGARAEATRVVGELRRVKGELATESKPWRARRRSWKV